MTTLEMNSETKTLAEESSSRRSSKRAKIGFFGIFGIQNLGNECTLQSILYNTRERFPFGEIYSICYRPDDTSRRHGVPAVPISARYFQSRTDGKVVHRKGGVVDCGAGRERNQHAHFQVASA